MKAFELNVEGVQQRKRKKVGQAEISQSGSQLRMALRWP